jgi:nitrite reductase (NADH) large subunit
VSTPAFPNMLQMEPRVPRVAWIAIRAFTVAAALALIGALFADPHWALSVFWGIFIPLTPLLFFLAPGLWRNICPLAAVNQTARVFRFSRGLTLPEPLVEHAYLIPVVLLFGLIPARRVLFNTNGPAVGALLLGVGALAFFGGVALRGKSGWCSTFCPLLPVQRIYGQTPFAIVRNSHCEPCVGCAKNCFDFNPQVAQFADLYDDHPVRPAYRKLFVGAFPGLVLAYFTIGNHGVLRTYELFAAVVLASAGLFLLLDTVVRISTATIPTLFAAAALNIFYWYSFPRLAQRLAHAQPDWWVWGSRGVLAALTLVWVARTLRKEDRFVEVASAAGGIRLGAGIASALRDTAAIADVTVLPQQRRIAVESGATLLEVIEKAGLSIESGCRMGMCGADPICVIDGADSLSAVGDDERSTLERLGLAGSTRMACCARVRGPVSISLTPERRIAAAGAEVAHDTAPGIERVVIVGNGIAGTTAADYVRRRHPSCSIDLVAREEHFLYNRMAISRLVYGRSAMQGLYLQPEEWYEEQRITPWLNTRAARIDRERRELVLATGEALPYDRLILAAGSEARVPPIEGMDLPGSFVMRTAEDAMDLRAYAQESGARRAVVVGGGLLGLEAAYALHQLGVRATVLHHSQRLLNHQLDERCSALVLSFLEGLGVSVSLEAEAVAVRGAGRVQDVLLEDGQTVPADLFLVCTGVRSNVELARAAQLEVGNGVVVDDRMRTSDPAIFAAGDIAEFEGRTWGLWPTAVEQGRIAALNALGADERYVDTPPVTMLKVTGADLLSAGRFEPEEGDEVVVLEDPVDHRYRKLVVRDGAIVGAIVFGYPLEGPGVAAAMKSGRDLSPQLDALRSGDWSGFVDRPAVVPSEAVA